MTSAARTARSPGPALFLVIRGGHLRTTTDTRPTSVYLHDLTLRAGMHAIRHRYTTEQVSRIAKALDDAGVDEIEIAHGDGLSGCRPNYGAGAHTDPEWIEAPASVVTKAQLTTLSLPGIGTIDDLKLVHSLGVRSVRVATPATEADVSAQHISAARELGMDVSGFSDDEPHGLTDAPRRTSQADGSLRRALREHHRLGWTAGHERRTSADARLPRGPRSRGGDRNPPHQNLSLYVANSVLRSRKELPGSTSPWPARGRSGQHPHRSVHRRRRPDRMEAQRSSVEVAGLG